jgi:hypothetical protein
MDEKQKLCLNMKYFHFSKYDQLQLVFLPRKFCCGCRKLYYSVQIFFSSSSSIPDMCTVLLRHELRATTSGYRGICSQFVCCFHNRYKSRLLTRRSYSVWSAYHSYWRAAVFVQLLMGSLVCFKKGHCWMIPFYAADWSEMVGAGNVACVLIRHLEFVYWQSCGIV